MNINFLEMTKKKKLNKVFGMELASLTSTSGQIAYFNYFSYYADFMAHAIYLSVFFIYIYIYIYI
jgi:hypothetical protein